MVAKCVTSFFMQLVRAKNAMKDFRKRLLDNSGNVVYHTLLVLDSLMKNCASDVHSEVLSVEFLGVVKAVITSSKVSSGLVNNTGICTHAPTHAHSC